MGYVQVSNSPILKADRTNCTYFFFFPREHLIRLKSYTENFFFFLDFLLNHYEHMPIIVYMRIYFDCIPCFVRQVLDSVRHLGREIGSLVVSGPNHARFTERS